MRRFISCIGMLFIILYGSGLLFLACTDDDDSDPEDTPTPTPTMTPTSTPTVPPLNNPIIVSPVDGIMLSSPHPLVVIEDTNSTVSGTSYVIQLSDQADLSNILAVEACPPPQDGLMHFRFGYALVPSNRYFYRCQADALGYAPGLTPISSIVIEFIGSNTPNLFVCTGDSITEGGYGIEYPAKLTPKLQEYFGDEAEAFNEGIGGMTSGNLFHYYLDTYLWYYRPAYLILLIGINDLMFPGACYEPYNCQTLEYLARTAEACQANQTIPILCTLTPCLYYEECFEPTQELNDQIRSYCLNNGLDLVDLHEAISDYNGNLADLFLPDGLHPNELGYEYLASIFFDYLSSRGSSSE
ncbi:SGNH/GDSL hydrolase family protein [bacterium]|nr:SGNH/GDSL hydrolase family protein [bacterium]